MNTEAVLAFVAVAEEGQFQLAADRLGISQQAVSKRIAALEADLGTALFRRTPAGAVLTEDGRTFLPHASAVVAAVRAAVASVQPGTRPLRVDVLARAAARRSTCCAASSRQPGAAGRHGDRRRRGGDHQGAAGGRDRRRLRLPARRGGRARPGAARRPTPTSSRSRSSSARGTRWRWPAQVRLADLARYPAWVPGIVAGSEWETFYQDLAAAFGLDIDPTGYVVGTESVFDAVAASALAGHVRRRAEPGRPARAARAWSGCR